MVVGFFREEVLKRLRTFLNSTCLLAHFDQQKELVLAINASSYGLGAVLLHKMDDRTEQPIGFASRSLTSTEKIFPT